jgi:ribosomal protein S18 acetylase RimI-like enzyme
MDILPATLERWPDVDLLLGGNGKGGCWCQPWRGRDDVAKATGESRPDTLRRQMAAAVPPGFLAYQGGEPVGWVGVSVRTETPGLMRSRKIPAIDDQPYWSIGCFRIRVGFRRKGVANALLHGVIEAAKRAAAPGVEAYPIDPEGRRVDVTFAYVGLVGMFDAAGFRRVLLTDATSAGLRRHLVRLDLP